jgi:hypothetical protein
MCKAKSCRYYKKCLVKRELVGDTRCGDYEPGILIVRNKKKTKEDKR